MGRAVIRASFLWYKIFTEKSVIMKVFTVIIKSTYMLVQICAKYKQENYHKFYLDRPWPWGDQLCPAHTMPPPGGSSLCLIRLSKGGFSLHRYSMFLSCSLCHLFSMNSSR
jgi:hypothetical protein